MTAPATSGTVLDTDGHCTIQFRRTIAHPPQRVWDALVLRDELEYWFPSPPDRDLAEDARPTFRFPDEGAPPLPGAVSVFEPLWVLEYTWDADLLRFELRPAKLAARAPTSTRLRFTQTFAEPARAVRDAAGWHTCLDLLEVALEGTTPTWTMGQLWTQVHAEYVTAFGAAHHADCVCEAAAAGVTRPG